MLALYEQAEPDSLALTAHLALGDCTTGEHIAAVRSLRPRMVRSRAIATTRLTEAQLAQGDAAATATAMKISAVCHLNTLV